MDDFNQRCLHQMNLPRRAPRRDEDAIPKRLGPELDGDQSEAPVDRQRGLQAEVVAPCLRSLLARLAAFQ